MESLSKPQRYFFPETVKFVPIFFFNTFQRWTAPNYQQTIIIKQSTYKVTYWALQIRSHLSATQKIQHLKHNGIITNSQADNGANSQRFAWDNHRAYLESLFATAHEKHTNRTEQYQIMGGMASSSKISAWVSTEQLESQTRAVARKEITIIRYRVQLYIGLCIYRTKYNYIDIYS